MEQMQALVWTGPRQLEMQAYPTARPSGEEVLIRVGAVGLCGSDLSGYLGQNSLRVPPLVMGHEITGAIAGLGEGAPRLAGGEVAQEGQRVTVNPLIACGECDLCRLQRPNLCRQRQILGIHRPGGFAELVAVPAAQCHVLPDHVDDARGSLAEPLACGIRAFAQTRLGDDEPLLILGAGPIGLLALVAAKAAGVERVIITDTSVERLDVARDLGAMQALQVGQADVLQEVQQLTDGLGVAAAIDAVGLPSTREQAVRAARPGSRAVFIGLHHETSELQANYLVRQEIEVVGAFAYLPEEFRQAVELLSSQDFSAPWIAERPLADGAAVFADLVAGRGGYVKVALVPGQQ